MAGGTLHLAGAQEWSARIRRTVPLTFPGSRPSCSGSRAGTRVESRAGIPRAAGSPCGPAPTARSMPVPWTQKSRPLASPARRPDASYQNGGSGADGSGRVPSSIPSDRGSPIVFSPGVPDNTISASNSAVICRRAPAIDLPVSLNFACPAVDPAARAKAGVPAGYGEAGFRP